MFIMLNERYSDMATLPLAEYRPDTAVVNSPYTSQLINVLPSQGSYVPMPSLYVISHPVPEPVLSAIAVRVGDVIKIFAGTEKHIYLYDQAKRRWLDVTQTGKTYNATKQEPWSFAVFGNLLIAVNYWDKPQSFALKSGVKFEDLAGNPPQAGMVKVWGSFVCLMRLREHPNRVHWSGLEDPTHWIVGQKDCDYNDFPEGEYIQNATSTTDPLIFMRTAIYKGAFMAGSKIIFSFQKRHSDRGVKSFRSVAHRGNMAFFLDDAGFYQIDDSGEILAIGSHKVDRTIFQTYTNQDLDQIHGVVDPIHNRVYWTLRPEYEPQKTYVYDWELGQWSTLQMNPCLIVPLYSFGYSLDQLDEISKELDQLPLSLDNRIWQHAAPTLGAFDAQGRLGYFTGHPMEAIIVSQAFADARGHYSFFHKAYAEVDTVEGKFSVGYKLARGSTINQEKWSEERNCSYLTGAFSVRCRSQIFRLRLRIPANTLWRHFTGFDVLMRQAGRR